MLIDLNRLLQLRCQLDAVLFVDFDHGLQARFPRKAGVSRLMYREGSSRLRPGLCSDIGAPMILMGALDGMSTQQRHEGRCEKC